MSGPTLFSLEVEEALCAALLLHDDLAGLEECEDADLWYDHTRAIVGAVRVLSGANKPCGTVFVLALLEPRLDTLAWKGLQGEALILDILSRHLSDPQAWYSRQLGRLIHYYADRRKAMKEAQEAAKLTFSEVMDAARRRYEGELA